VVLLRSTIHHGATLDDLCHDRAQAGGEQSVLSRAQSVERIFFFGTASPLPLLTPSFLTDIRARPVRRRIDTVDRVGKYSGPPTAPAAAACTEPPPRPRASVTRPTVRGVPIRTTAVRQRRRSRPSSFLSYRFARLTPAVEIWRSSSRCSASRMGRIVSSSRCQQPSAETKCYGGGSPRAVPFPVVHVATRRTQSVFCRTDARMTSRATIHLRN